MNTAHPCYLDFFGVTVSWGLKVRDDNDEVVGSIPTGPTIFFIFSMTNDWRCVLLGDAVILCRVLCRKKPELFSRAIGWRCEEAAVSPPTL
jgi:hypothetical protein